MKKWFLLTTLLVILIAVGRVSAQIARFQGEWVNDSRQTSGMDDIARIKITIRGDAAEVHLWYTRPLRECPSLASKPALENMNDSTGCGPSRVLKEPAGEASVEAGPYAPNAGDASPDKASALVVTYPGGRRRLVFEFQGTKLLATMVDSSRPGRARVEHSLFKRKRA
jgi:hypothetical protein